MIGVYKIENLITHEVYIGQSESIEKRWSTHKSRAADHNFNTKLYQSMREYGIEGEITDEKRAKYLECLIADEYDIPCQYNKREVIKID
jgi:predicted GIY-YIG superfamily endonuclease